MSDHKANPKRDITPVRLTVTVEARKISQKGTFSSFDIISVKGPNSSTKAVSHTKSGGAIYIQSPILDGIELAPEKDGKAKPEPTKLW